jgi:hypothetical protein
MPSGSRTTIDPWFVGIAVVIPALMGVVGTTIVGVARPYIAGGLSAPAADDEWVMTSYWRPTPSFCRSPAGCRPTSAAATYFLWSIAVFTIASVLCGMATSLPQLILFRVIQGLAAAGFSLRARRSCWTPFPREAGRRPDDVLHRRPCGADRRPGAERLARRQLQLALDLLHQRAGGARRLPGLLRPAGGPGLPEARAGRN